MFGFPICARRVAMTVRHTAHLIRSFARLERSERAAGLTNRFSKLSTVTEDSPITDYWIPIHDESYVLCRTSASLLPVLGLLQRFAGWADYLYRVPSKKAQKLNSKR
eukprot:2000173-Amphidinium_carterae.1